MQVVDHYSATTGLLHEINVARHVTHEDICRFAEDGTDLSIIANALKAGKVYYA